MRNYVYQKDFLGQWMQDNGVKLADVRRVLGLEGTDKIKVWAGQTPPAEIKTEREDRGWLPLKHILKLCNHYDLPISSFIVNAEEPPTKKIRSTTPSATADKEATALRLELLQTKLDHQQEINALQTAQQQREDRLREEYEQRMSALREDYDGRLAAMKRQYEERLAQQQRLMQQTIDSQREQLTMLHGHAGYYQDKKGLMASEDTTSPAV